MFIMRAKFLSHESHNYESVKMNHNPNWPHILDHPHRILIYCLRKFRRLQFIKEKECANSI